MTLDHYKTKMSDEIYKQAVLFINGLVAQGVPLSAICTNDGHSCPSVKVCITREYGRKNGGKNKTYERFNKLNCKRGADFYNAN